MSLKSEAIKRFLTAARSLANQGMTKESIINFAKNEFGEITELFQKQIDNIFKRPPSGIEKIKVKDEVFDNTVIKLPVDDTGAPFNPKDPLKQYGKPKKTDDFNLSEDDPLGDLEKIIKGEGDTGLPKKPSKGLSDKDFRSEKTSFRLNIGKNSPEFNQDLAKKIINREIYTDLSDSQRKEFLNDLDFVLKNPRGDYYTGGLVDIEPSLSDIGHGSDALMARTRLMSPGSQATTSTGLNYLLAEDNDNIRVPFEDGKNFEMYLKERERIERQNRLEQLLREYEEDMLRQKVMEQKQMAAEGGRIGFSKGKIVKESLEGLAQLLKKEKARTQRISGNLRLENMQRTKIGKPKLDEDEYDYYREILDDEENNIVMGDETKEFLEAMVKEQEAEMAYMKRLYDKGALNPTAGETTMGRLKMLEDKAQSGESLSAEEIAEIKRLSEIFNKAQGGRIGFSKGKLADAARRKFMKAAGAGAAGLAALKTGLINLAKDAGPKVEAVKESVSGVPDYFFRLVEKIRFMGDETMASQDKAIAKKYKDYVMEEDFGGNITIVKSGEDLEGNKLEDVYMSYKVDDVSVPNKKGFRKVEEYEEFTARPDAEGKMKDVESGVPDEVIEEAGDVESMTLKKASGGVAKLLGE